VHGFVKQHFQDRKQTESNAGKRASSLSASISVYRACLAQPLVSTHLLTLLDLHPDLKAFVNFNAASSNETPDVSLLRDHIHALIVQGAADESASQNRAAEEMNPLSAYPPPPTEPSLGSNFSPIDQIKGRLPSTRSGLHHLRASPSSPPTSDPTEMGAIASTSWGAIWGARKSTISKSRMKEYLKDYTTRLPDGSLRDKPSLEDMISAIRGTNNSSPGPDGIPFAFYRLFAEEVAPVLLRILDLMASKRVPPGGFNHGILFLLAKDCSMLIDHTRPISVANADNRIIAKLLADLLGPIFNDILHTSQKGFIPKRCGLDHVRAITSLFYGAVTKNDQHYILFLDTKKAFDSVDHSFIHAMLREIGVPDWIRHTIHGLMTNVMVRPSFADSAAHDIPILRGVKQGCPLSPLLFALCYDFLLTELARSDTHGSFTFADDLAINASSLQPIINALHSITKFAKFSGLGLNLDKTVVLSAQPPFPETMGRLHLWYPGIRFVTSAKYLGVIMGPDISTKEVFQVAFDKFFSRARHFAPIIRSSTLHHRILIYNVFLLPVLYYLVQFYIMPYTEMIVPIREHCRKAICAFSGGAFGYCHLINTPRTSFGPFTPLRDLWATNMTLLASRSPILLASNGHGHPVLGEFDHITNPDWGNMLIEEHEAYCAWVFLYDHGPRDLHKLLKTAHLTGSIATTRRDIYRQLIQGGYWQQREVDKKSFPTSLPNKLRRFFPSIGPAVMAKKVQHLKDNLHHAGSTPKPGQWNTWLRCITNALPTDCRLASANIFPTNRSPGRQLKCFLCGDDVDDLRHVFSDCVPVQMALISAAEKVKLTLPATATLTDLVTLTVPLAQPTDAIFAIFIITFVWAVWSDRQRFFSTLPQPLSEDQTARRLEEYTLSHLPKPRAKRMTPAAILELANNPPPEAIVGFSDGSAIPNPGPCGAGALLFLPQKVATVTCAMSLGEGDNNIGEIAGLHKLLELIDEAYQRKLVRGHPPILLFTDSLLVVGALEWGWAMKNMPRSIHSLLKAYRARKALNPTLLYWVKAHSDVANNEKVDKEAKVGATWSGDVAQNGRTRTRWDIQ
jgi:ribonuclease HI